MRLIEMCLEVATVQVAGHRQNRRSGVRVGPSGPNIEGRGIASTGLTRVDEREPNDRAARSVERALSFPMTAKKSSMTTLLRWAIR